MSKSFRERYEIQVINDTGRVSRVTTSPTWFSDLLDKDLVINCNQQSEKLLTITIPESQLTRLEEIHRVFFNNSHISQNYSRMFDMIMEQRTAERRIRDLNPGVKAAHEYYSTLLHLAGHSDKVDLDK